MAMPGAGPMIGLPRYCNSPSLGSESPAINRNSVDLPEPDRPSKPTICPSRSSKFMPWSTNSSAPSGLAKDFRTSVHCNSGELLMRNPSSSQPVFAFGVVVQRPPEQPVDDHDEQTHRAYS